MALREDARDDLAQQEGDATMTDDVQQSDEERLEEAKKRVAAKKGFFGHAFVFLVINVVGLIAAGEDWLWVTLFWGVGLAFQAFAVFFQDSTWLKTWEHKQIQKELAKGSPAPAPTPPAPTPPATDETQS
jgi:hypothetical protein